MVQKSLLWHSVFYTVENKIVYELGSKYYMSDFLANVWGPVSSIVPSKVVPRSYRYFARSFYLLTYLLTDRGTAQVICLVDMGMIVC